MSLAKILLPVDFSERCLRASHCAIRLAERFRSEITVLHVLPPHYEFGSVELGSAILVDLIAERLARARQQIDSYLSEEMRHLPVKRLLLEGDPAHQIVDYAHKEHCDLITMPTHGHGLFRRMLLGSVTAKVLHDVECPVWTGIHMENPPPAAGRMGHVLCAVDLGPSSLPIVQWAAGMATEFQASLTILHAVESLDPRTESYFFSPEWRRFVFEEAKTDMEKLRTEAAVKAEIELKSGPAARTICSEVVRLKPDLLVIGRGAITSTLGRLHSNAYAVIRGSVCPVVSV